MRLQELTHLPALKLTGEADVGFQEQSRLDASAFLTWERGRKGGGDTAWPRSSNNSYWNSVVRPNFLDLGKSPSLRPPRRLKIIYFVEFPKLPPPWASPAFFNIYIYKWSDYYCIFTFFFPKKYKNQFFAVSFAIFELYFMAFSYSTPSLKNISIPLP